MLRNRRPILAGSSFNTTRYKPGRFAKDFGDRWIHGFKTGGKMVARVTFTSKDVTKVTDVKAHAQAALSFWGVKGDLSVDGELGIFMRDKEGSPKDILLGSVDAVLSEVKSWADKFESQACTHNYAYGPRLDEYDVVPGFSDLEDSPEASDCDIAYLYAVGGLSLIVKIEEKKNIISSAKNIADKKKREVSTAATNMIAQGKKWVKTAAQYPDEAEEQAISLMQTLSANFIDKYKGDVTSARKVTDPGGFAKCKKLQNDKTEECVGTHGATQNGTDVLEFYSSEGKNVFDQCRAGTL
ncbi:hypothetical protein MY4038_009320 [Beauveria bassiana]